MASHVAEQQGNSIRHCGYGVELAGINVSRLDASMSRVLLQTIVSSSNVQLLPVLVCIGIDGV